MTYFDSFEVEYISKEILKIIGDKKIINIYRIQAFDSTFSGYFCIEFIDFLFNSKGLTGFTNLSSPHDFQKYNKVILDRSLKESVIMQTTIISKNWCFSCFICYCCWCNFWVSECEE